MSDRNDLVTATVIAAGALPQPELREPNLDGTDRWFLPRSERDLDNLPPRVLLEVSQEGARALAGWMYQEVEIVVRPKAKVAQNEGARRDDN